MTDEERAHELAASVFEPGTVSYFDRRNRIKSALTVARAEALEEAAHYAEAASCKKFDDAWIIARGIRALAANPKREAPAPTEAEAG